MKQEEKELLLKDLCARLPYGVKIALNNNGAYHHENVAKTGDITIDKLKGFNGRYFSIYHNDPLDWDWYDNDIDIKDIKPYLFPLLSMTEEQIKEVNKLQGLRVFPNPYIINWYLENHFDIYGLIPKGLALDATGLNIY